MSNQDYTQSGQGMDEGMDQGTGRDLYGQDVEQDQYGQGTGRDLYGQGTEQDQYGQGMGGTRGTGERDYGMSDQYAQSGTLNEGYGQGQQMGEEQWSQQGGQMNPNQDESMRGTIGKSASDRFAREMSERAGGGGDTGEDFRDMAGGMFGGGDDSQRDR